MVCKQWRIQGLETGGWGTYTEKAGNTQPKIRREDPGSVNAFLNLNLVFLLFCVVYNADESNSPRSSLEDSPRPPPMKPGRAFGSSDGSVPPRDRPHKPVYSKKAKYPETVPMEVGEPQRVYDLRQKKPWHRPDRMDDGVSDERQDRAMVGAAGPSPKEGREKERSRSARSPWRYKGRPGSSYRRLMRTRSNTVIANWRRINDSSWIGCILDLA